MFKRVLTFVLFINLVLLLQVPQVLSQQKYNIKEMTPAVQSALENRRDRYDALKEFKQNGIIGENNKGYVEVLNSDKEAEKIARAENKDRKVIYETIAEQNNLEGALGTIEEIFAQVQREKAESGEKIQTKDGNWIEK